MPSKARVRVDLLDSRILISWAARYSAVRRFGRVSFYGNPEAVGAVCVLALDTAANALDLFGIERFHHQLTAREKHGSESTSVIHHFLWFCKTLEAVPFKCFLAAA